MPQRRMEDVQRHMSETSTDSSDAELLEALDISVQFEGLAALNDLSISLGRTEIFGLIGPNGSGQDDAGQRAHRLSKGDSRNSHSRRS